jgi:aerobic-type carbon monoxide dehydrogenase small subunit (CoxS/CutS family)
MGASIEIVVDGRTYRVDSEVTLAAALLDLGVSCRRSLSGELRAPLCGMGICFECRVAIDGLTEQRACLEPVRAGMRVTTGTASA